MNIINILLYGKFLLGKCNAIVVNHYLRVKHDNNGHKVYDIILHPLELTFVLGTVIIFR